MHPLSHGTTPSFPQNRENEFGGEEGTVILWNAKCLASSASCSEFGVSEQEEQNKAEDAQDKSFLSGVFRKSYDLCIST